jgi:hypothetical protein
MLRMNLRTLKLEIYHNTNEYRTYVTGVIAEPELKN